MKEKIANALKTRYANLGLSDKAFNGVASFLEKTITDEKDIDNAVAGDDVKALVTSYQSETDSLRGAKAALEREYAEYKQAHPAQSSSVLHDNEAMEQTLARISALEAELKAKSQKESREVLLKEVREKMKANGSTAEPILNLVLASAEIGEGDTADNLATKYKEVYDEKYKEFYGNGQIPPRGGLGDEGYKPGDFAGVKERLQSQGKLPKA